jgi:hypothetical protein
MARKSLDTRGQDFQHRVSGDLCHMLYIGLYVTALLRHCPWGRLQHLGAFAELRKATISLVMSVCLSVRPFVLPSASNDVDPTGSIFMKFDVWLFFENLSKISSFLKNLTRLTGYLHEDLCTFMITSRWVLLRMRNISDKSCRENQSTHFMFNNFFPENRAVYEIMWKNMVQRDRPQMTI